LGETPEISLVLWGLWTFRLLRGELVIALEIAEDFLRLSEHLSYPGHMMRAHFVMEVTCMHRGEFASAMEHFEKTLSIYNPERHRDDAFFYTQNPGVGMRCFAAWALWFLGQPDQALNRVQEALTLARELSEPHGVAYALSFAAILHQLRREPRIAQEYAEEGLAISTEHGLAMYKAQSTMTRAWALIERGKRGEAIEQMRQGFADFQATGTELLTPYFGSLLAEALGKERKAEEGLRRLKEWVEVAHLNANASHLAEAYRIKGELLLIQGTSRAVSQAAPAGKAAFEVEPRSIAQAEACFNQSIHIAREQKAKSWELRTVMSVARLYQNQGKQKQARGLLAEIYNRFTEGFETADLREAKALLDASS
jgi:predicted ATPase